MSLEHDVTEVRKLFEQDIFQPATPEEVRKRKESIPKFKCPHCKEELDSVYGETKSAYTAKLLGNRVVEEDDFGTEPITSFFCPECDEEVTSHIDY